ncbi:transporter substrate-binding domain-containing protein [Microbacterium protaetiae]|uniref:Putative aliphatic sulfonates-binding protein n=1 Tax=Microbacterium protaetiae TaxID=2509458 RepID=A0A4P6EB40_9MICO|nr:NrtA/SsuA/CpmA family ABC transporter substrate-binding protein [Microbacterium protaetiae]QAY59370.1 transporter substrate-binding domain-containing protein [Microbacterium protaetiae]
MTASRALSALALVALAATGLVGCAAASADSGDAASITVRIPDPGNSGSLALGKKDGSLDKALAAVGAKVAWTGTAGAFAPAALSLNAGELDVATGSITSAVMALGQTPSFELFAAAAPDDNGEGILVKDGSGIESITDLVGKKVAVWHGSTSEYLLLKALEQAGLADDSVERVYLQPAQSAAVFHSGKVDAWATWSSFSITERASQDEHFLVTGKQIGSQNYSVLAVRNDFADQHPAVVAALYDYIHAKDLDRIADPEPYLNVFRTSGADALDAAGVQIAADDTRAAHPLQAIGAQQLADFAEVAKFYADRGITDGTVDVAAHVLDVTTLKG